MGPAAQRQAANSGKLSAKVHIGRALSLYRLETRPASNRRLWLSCLRVIGPTATGRAERLQEAVGERWQPRCSRPSRRGQYKWSGRPRRLKEEVGRAGRPPVSPAKSGYYYRSGGRPGDGRGWEPAGADRAGRSTRDDGGSNNHSHDRGSGPTGSKSNPWRPCSTADSNSKRCDCQAGQEINNLPLCVCDEVTNYQVPAGR